MAGTMHQLMAGYQPCPVTFQTPHRKSFVTRKFKGFLGAVLLLSKSYRERYRVRAEDAYNDAIRAHSIGRFNQAEAAYVRCLELMADHEPARNNLAALYVERNNPDLAVEELMKARLARPDHFRPYYNLGLVYQMVGRWKDAVEMMKQAIVLEPGHFWSHLALGELMADHEAAEEAVDHYRRALEHTDEPHPVYVRLAELYVSLRRFDEAEQCLEKARDLHPLPEIHYNLGWLSAAMGRGSRETVALFAAAERGRPQLEHALFNLALAQSLDGQFEASVESMRRYIREHVKKHGPETVHLYEVLREVNPENFSSMLEIAKLYIQANRTEQAIEVLNRLLELRPEFTEGAVMLAETYRDLGRYKDSIQVYRRLIENEPENVRGYLGLAKSFGAIGNYAAALPVIKKVLDLDPHNADIHYQYATLMAQQGKLTIAYKHYRTVAQLDQDFPHIKKRMRMIEEEMEETGAQEDRIWPLLERGE